MNKISSLILSAFFFIILFAETKAQQYQFSIPKVEGISIEKGESIRIPGPTTATVFQFKDGRIVLGTGKDVKWSSDKGHTWVEGGPGPNARNTVDLGNGEIICVQPNSIKRPDGKFTLKLQRSIDNWKTVVNEESVLDIPNSSFTVTGDGSIKDGFIFHHGILKLDDGTLIGTMYGNYEGDNIYCDGYPPELNQRKYRTIVVFSKDKGSSWENNVLVAYDKMLGRGIEDNHPLLGKYASATSIVPAITQEGFREADIVRAANGDLLCLMRSGGRNGKAVNLFPTPLYCSRSTDNGKSWSPPAQIADRGVCPNAVTLENGIIVCTYSRPGNWLIFSDDNGITWKGAFQFATSDDYNFIVETEQNVIQVYHEVKEGNQKIIYGSYFKIERR
ncbi:MAG: sialidase family protein [Ignavibacteriales bacterium]|nr:sialidase family protein [Ignavibacteriales bacterium]